ncbi:MAG TPA: phosphate signaling complex protein PhoU [Candidatus Omnitrophota bacterium]|nr:phosphate signaling complex protein PhoU [Candidatus Omnitrophota bacterium]
MERHFHEELKELTQKLQQMGFFAEAAIEKATDGFLNSSGALARKVYDDENVINRLEIEIDEKGHNLLALAQPVAGDLRRVVTVLKINTDLERMGDHAVNIAQKTPLLPSELYLIEKIPLGEMAQTTQKTVRAALDCFVNGDSELARHVLWHDDKIDCYYDTIYSHLGNFMTKEPSLIGAGMKLVMIAHDLERIGDLANNIAENVIYMLQGKEVRHHAWQVLR